MSVSLIQALCVRENVVRLVFDVPIYFTGVLDPGDASDVARYSIAPDLSTVGANGSPPRPVFPARADLASPTQVDLWVDRRFSPFPSRYVAKAVGVLTADGLSGLLVDSAPFFSVQAGDPRPSSEVLVSNADLANPQTVAGAFGSVPNPTEAVLGTLPVDDTGDIARDQGLASYKKRVLRRLTTPKGRYRHLPKYGVNIPQSVKLLARATTLQSLASDAEDQIHQEPETVKVQVTVVMQGPVAFFRVRVRCSLSVDPVDLFAPVPFGA